MKYKRENGYAFSLLLVKSWYLNSIPSYLSILLDLPVKDIENIVYYNEFFAENSEGLASKAGP